MAYKIVFTQTAKAAQKRYLEYLLFDLRNPQAATNVLNDMEKTINAIRIGAESYSLCSDSDLQTKNLRKFHLKHHSYKIYYKVIGKTAYIENILHDKQDFKNILN